MTLHRVGIIGTGGIAIRHAEGYRLAGAELAAIADVNPVTLELRQHEWSVPKGYLDYRDLLNDPDIDAVSVCTPNALHAPVTIAAAKAGKHVLCEKPASMDLQQAQAMIDACTEAGVTLQIGHHLRSMATAVRAKEIIDSGRIGRVTYARFRQAHDWGGATTVRPSFGLLANSGGGTLLDNGCHLFDLARFFGGDVAEVFARTATLKFECEVEDTAVSSLRYTSGALANVEVAWTATGWHEAFWVYGTEGSLEYDNRVSETLLLARTRESDGTTWVDVDMSTYELRGHESHLASVVNFLAAVNGTRDVVCTGHDGLEAVRLVLASYESAAKGLPVTLA